MHEGLRIDVFVVLDEVEPALQRLVDDAAVVLAGKAELGLGGGAEQRAAELVEALALDHDAGRRPLEGLHVGDRQAHVLEPAALSGLKQNTLPMIEAVRLAIEPSSNRSRS